MCTAPPPGPFTTWRSIEWGILLVLLFARRNSTVSPSRIRIIGPGTAPLNDQNSYSTPSASTPRRSTVSRSTSTVAGPRFTGGGTLGAEVSAARTVPAGAADAVGGAISTPARAIAKPSPAPATCRNSSRLPTRNTVACSMPSTLPWCLSPADPGFHACPAPRRRNAQRSRRSASRIRPAFAPKSMSTRCSRTMPCASITA